MRDPLRPLLYDNLEHIWRSVAAWLRSPKRKPKHTLGLGIDRSDSLLYEGLTGHARELIPMFADADKNPAGCRLILLTKSANVHYLEGLSTKRVVVTFSVNPEPIADLWEGKYPDTLERISPPIERRLEACKEAQRMGFETRLRLDPILTPQGWREMYAEFFAKLERMKLHPSRITLGTYREKNAQLDHWRKRWGLPAMEWEPPELTKEGTHRHLPEGRRTMIYSAIRDMTRTNASIASVHLCKETHAVRKTCGLCDTRCNCLS